MHLMPLGGTTGAAAKRVPIARVQRPSDGETGRCAVTVVQNTRSVRADENATGTDALGREAEDAERAVTQTVSSLEDSTVAQKQESLVENLLETLLGGALAGEGGAADWLLEVSWKTARCCTRRRGAQEPNEASRQHLDQVVQVQLNETLEGVVRV